MVKVRLRLLKGCRYYLAMSKGIYPLSLLVLATGVFVSGCALTPRLDVAPNLLSDAWSQGLPEMQAGLAVNRPQTVAALLQSPEIETMTAQALLANPNMLAAQTRIDQALAGIRIARGAALPLVSVSNGLSTTRSVAKGAFDFSSSFAAIDASFSVDLWGRVAAGKRSALQRARAARFDRDDFVVALQSEIARTYVQHTTLQARISLLDRNLAATTKLQHILELRQREGVATRVDVGLQVIRVSQLLAERSRLEQAFDQTRTALALLIGVESPRFLPTSTTLNSFARTPPAVPLPSEIMPFRADVLAAEARIHAAGGDVVQARAAFFPSLDLSLNRLSQTVLSGGPLAGLTLGANLLLPIFNRGRLKGELDSAAALQREAVQNYRQVLLAALAQVEDALSAARHSRDRAAILEDIEREARLTANLAQQQYLEGEADLRNVLDAQDQLINAQDARVVSVQEQLEASIALFRATQTTAKSGRA